MATALMYGVVMMALGALARAIFQAVPLVSTARTFVGISRRAVKTMTSSTASDHWKEKAVLGYAVRIFKATAKSILLMALILGPVVVICGLLNHSIMPGLLSFSLTPLGLFAATIGAFLPLHRKRNAKIQEASNYSTVEKLLHRIALSSRAVAEISFDIDQSMTRKKRTDPTDGAHVFVVGLARAGTTALMREIHNSGAFRSLKYEDMPFVLAPNLWRRMRGPRQAELEAPPKERAHGDGLMVNGQSPECLDEVFWRVFDGESYIGSQSLQPHNPSDEKCGKFRDYVSSILAAHPAKRYLSKNNNNLLRLGALRKIFPKSHILIMIRDPLDHAASLWRQHKRFVEQQDNDPFVKQYMNWLAHHEFGANHRPIAPSAAVGSSPDELVYWLRQWTAVYGGLQNNLPANSRVICYEKLCGDPSEWQDIARSLEIPAGTSEFMRPSHSKVDFSDLEHDLRAARQVYESFRIQS
jgi:hypothetical protein